MALTMVSSNGGRGLALNIKLLRHTRSRGKGLLVATGSVAGIRANWERHLLGLPIRFVLKQLFDKCMWSIYSTIKHFDPSYCHI